ncbi:DUF459 domain-containing protein [Mycolicibacterium thermoresistibile]
MQHRGAPKARDRARRRDGIAALDGLRAIAVALVLVGHGGIPGVPGGFIGVDVFFVLSGFLITSLLLEELGNSGRINLTGFWARRARRLLPALVLMVLAVAFARQVFPSEAVAGLRDDALAALLWLANWHLIAEETDYFSQGGAPSPLQHTWSLGVEEQYYLLWPLLVLGLTALLAVVARRRGRRLHIGAVRAAVFVLATAGVVASAAAAVLMTAPAMVGAGADGDTVNRVYFGTDTRAQGLLIGAAAAALLVRDWPALTAGWSLIRTRWGRWLARVSPVLGLALIGAAAHYLTGSAEEFRAGALTVVAVAAILVIAPVALDQDGLVARLLAWRPLVFLGAISYGVYLWHWPIFLAINGERTGWSGLPLFVVRCILTVGIATLSWWLIEQPIRKWRPVRVPQLRLAAATVATAAVVTVQFVPVGVGPGGPAADSLPPGVSTAALEHPVDPVEAVRPVTPVPAGPRQHTVSVFGDSVAWTLMRYLPPTPDMTFVDRTTIGCGIARGGPYRHLGETLNQKPECDAWPARWSQRITYDKPDVALLIVGRWEIVDRVFEGRWTHIGDPAYDAYLTGELRRALDIISSTGARVIVTTVPYNRRGEKPDGSLYPEDRPERVEKWNTLLRRVVEQFPEATVLDLNKKLGPNGRYTAKVDGVRVRSDGVHFTPEGVEWLTPWLTEAVAPAPGTSGAK